MPHGAHVYSLLEDALSEGVKYHNSLDSFLLRAGVSDAKLRMAREQAEARAKAASNYSRAPKRFVVQALLEELGKDDDEGARTVASLITAISKGRFPDASPEGKTAIESLKGEGIAERREAEIRREEQQQKERERERQREKQITGRAAARDRFKEDFVQLIQQEDPQARGYMLEKFLNEFLGFEGLNPRSSFKLVGEQIDGSFLWSNRTYLVEAKWVSTPVGSAAFSTLM